MANIYGPPYHSEEVYRSLKQCGEGTKLYAWARLAKPGEISIGRGAQVDDFAILSGGGGLEVGDRVHIASYSSIVGGGEAVLADFSGLAAGCRIITGSEDFMGEGMTNPCVPDEYRSFKRSRTVIERHALLFTNVIVFPGVTVAEGCVIGANTVVSTDTEPWGVYVERGGRMTRVRDRPRDQILRYERECVEKYGY